LSSGDHPLDLAERKDTATGVDGIAVVKMLDITTLAPRVRSQVQLERFTNVGRNWELGEGGFEAYVL
jgi:hypothetical protein